LSGEWLFAPAILPSGDRDLAKLKEMPLPPQALEKGLTESVNGFETLLAKLLLCGLQSLGCCTPAARSLSDWAREIALPDLYHSWLQETARVLERHGLAKFEGDLCSGVSLQADDVWAAWKHEKTVWAGSPLLAKQSQLAEATLRALPEILAGRRTATEV